MDADRAALEKFDAQVAELRAQLRVAELPARDAQVAAARAAVSAAKAEVDRVSSALGDRTVSAPTGGLVDRVVFAEGEVAVTGSPVLSLLPPRRLNVLFFVPEPQRAAFAPGDALTVGCDGCPDGLSASVTRIAAEPQFTPPVIYSRDERQRLVYRAEARLDPDAPLRPGQPVTVRRP